LGGALGHLGESQALLFQKVSVSLDGEEMFAVSQFVTQDVDDETLKLFVFTSH
jgi:hypothetical protein